MSKFIESTVEQAALSWLDGLGYSILAGPDIAPDELLAERCSFADVILTGRSSRIERGKALKKL